jgi:hypothetical protein
MVRPALFPRPSCRAGRLVALLGADRRGGGLLDALEKVRAFGRQELVGGEPALVDDLIRDVDRIVRHR